MLFIKRWTTLLMIGLAISSISAQSPIRVSLFSESTTVPYTTFLNTPMHPGVQVGTSFDWKEGKHFRLYPIVSLGYMFHNHLFQGVYASVELALDYQTGIGLNFKSSIGLGYLHTFNTQQEYQFKNGKYQSKGDKGNSRMMPSFTLGLGYSLDPKNDTSTEIFFLYQSWIEYPYSPGFIPLMSHTSLHLGTSFYPFKAKK